MLQLEPTQGQIGKWVHDLQLGNSSLMTVGAVLILGMASTQSLSMPQEALDHLVDDIIDPANKFLAINKLLEEIKQQHP